MDIVGLVNKNINFKIGNLDISPTYWQAALIFFLIFLLVLTLARVRSLYLNWSLGKSAMAMLFWGFVLTIIFEGFFLIGGRTLFTEILGWKSAPKPISTALDIGRERLIKVLGVTEEIPSSYASEEIDISKLIDEINKLDADELEEVQSAVCAPYSRLR